jgi:hypothetical protein
MGSSSSYFYGSSSSYNLVILNLQSCKFVPSYLSEARGVVSLINIGSGYLSLNGVSLENMYINSFGTAGKVDINNLRVLNSTFLQAVLTVRYNTIIRDSLFENIQNSEYLITSNFNENHIEILISNCDFKNMNSGYYLYFTTDSSVPNPNHVIIRNCQFLGNNFCLYVNRMNLTITDSLFDRTRDPTCPFNSQPTPLECGYKYEFGSCSNDYSNSGFSNGLIKIDSFYGTISNTKFYNSTYAGIYVGSGVTSLSLDGVEMRGNNLVYSYGVDHPLGKEVNIYCEDTTPYIEIKNPKWGMLTGDYWIYGCDVVNYYDVLNRGEEDIYGWMPRVCLSVKYKKNIFTYFDSRIIRDTTRRCWNMLLLWKGTPPGHTRIQRTCRLKCTRLYSFPLL